jgi:hypothetical protein
MLILGGELDKGIAMRRTLRKRILFELPIEHYEERMLNVEKSNYNWSI